jgi:predicted N-formylglutamate amidohydrolase
VRNCLAAEIAARRTVLHLSVHSFTARLRGESRPTDIGLLFDPRRRGEEELCRTLRAALQGQLPDLQIDMNEPYSGVSDGLTTTLRAEFPKSRYLGVELEVNQRFARSERPRWRAVQQGIARALAASL